MLKLPAIATAEGSVTINGVTVTINTRNDVLQMRRLIDEFLRLTTPPAVSLGAPATLEALLASQRAPETNGAKPANTTKPSPGHRFKNGIGQPPPGHTTRDYIVRVLRTHSQGLYAHDLADKMLEAGWKTNSKQRPRLVQVNMYDHKDQFIKLPGGKWILRDKDKVSESNLLHHLEASTQT